MAKRNFLIGIGGTGARVAEAAIFLSAAGFGPDELTLILVDPDQGNGNVHRTKTLATRYLANRRTLTNLLPEGKFPLFRTDIKLPEKNMVWHVFEGEAAKEPDKLSLKRLLDYDVLDDETKGIIDLLYTPAELNTILTEGFRGHPSIGAAVMAQDPDPKSAFGPLYQELKADHVANDIAVFLVGSIFGGTGAAGVPTFGNQKVIKWHEDASFKGSEKSKVVLGGALVLPYFSFEEDKDREEREEGKIFVKPTDFALATKAALEYYASQQSRKLAFDEVYLVGDSLSQKVGKFAPGKSEQENGPHYMEIVTALAAFDFMRENDTRSADDKPAEQFFISKRDDEKVVWESFPVTRRTKDRDLQRKFRHRLIATTVFAYSFAGYGMFVLNNKSDSLAQNATWYHDLFNKSPDDPRAQKNRDSLAEIARLAKSYLWWLQGMCELDPTRVRLFNTNMIQKDPEKSEEREDQLILDWQNRPHEIGQLVNDVPPVGLQMKDYVAQRLNPRAAPLSKTTGKSSVEKFVELFVIASDEFTQANYEMK